MIRSLRNGLRWFASLILVASFGSAAAHAGDARWNTSDISFKSADGTVLSGSIIAPKDNHPKAIIVLVHGSGRTERYVGIGALMALRGVAVLTYDKRGVGKSGGHYEGTDNVSRKNLTLLASDASAAMTYLARDPRWRVVPRGFVGLSQGGFVVPLALPTAPGASFAGYWSGPPVTTSEQLHFQNFTAARDGDLGKFSKSELAAAMDHVMFRPDDFDPLKALADNPLPMLWLFGGKDPWIPVGLAVARLEKRIEQGRSNYAYRVFADEGHNLADSPEQASFTAMVDWIKAVVADHSAL